jgi:hypothetical protein
VGVHQTVTNSRQSTTGTGRDRGCEAEGLHISHGGEMDGSAQRNYLLYGEARSAGAHAAWVQRSGGIWSPEDLFVASANTCLITTFLAVAERAGLAFSSYGRVADGCLDLVVETFRLTTITVRPRIILRSEADGSKAGDLLQKPEATRLIATFRPGIMRGTRLPSRRPEQPAAGVTRWRDEGSVRRPSVKAD